MSSRHSIERLPGGGGVPAEAGRLRTPAFLGLACGAVAALLCACASSPSSESSPPGVPSAPPSSAADQKAGAGQSASVTTGAGKAASATTGQKSGTGATGPGAGGGTTALSGTAAAGSSPAEIPKRAVADFDRAVGMMRSGNATEAELEFKQISVAYPQLSAPYVNLGILFRKDGHFEQSEEALKAAVERNGSSAVAWTELGATQRLRGKFQDAAASYEKAIAADPNYAAAYRNLGVVSDLYLADPERALTAFERYKELTHEEKPVSGWIAELRQRTGKPAVRPPSAPADAPTTQPAPDNAQAAPAPNAGG